MISVKSFLRNTIPWLLELARYTIIKVRPTDFVVMAGVNSELTAVEVH